VVTVMVPLGDLESSMLRALAGLVAAYGHDQARVAIDQNLVLPDVAREDLPALHRGLARLGLAEAGAGTALDVTSCPGADTCNLGITSSKGVSRAIRSSLAGAAAGGGLDLLRGVTIKVSGCPNACGQHHVAGIGLHGVVKKIGARPAPAYQLHLGGRGGAPEARIGRVSMKLAAKRVPGAVSALLDLYRRRRRDGESFDSFVVRVPVEELNAALAPFDNAGDGGEESFYDWDRTEPYTTAEMGPGECAGAGNDPVEGPLDDYEAELAQTSRFMRRGRWADAAANLNRAQYTLARALLKALGRQPESDYETVCELRARVIDRGHASESWNLLHRDIEDLLRARRPAPIAVRAACRRAHELLAESRATLARLAAQRASATGAEVPG
jgi:nitrite/sulfite reductase ferredoxin-like protein